ncbi:hypothetical protein PV04_03985 [Phialophora macrospora]|uniref:Uncharacterized protein n=1 Tax=Phialophora macrospora TaxID=1851006 RepID=A0A0D2G813_9EURO|nr:hypothetical protein PV04_03985 [Phialophora macrospora]
MKVSPSLEAKDHLRPSARQARLPICPPHHLHQWSADMDRSRRTPDAQRGCCLVGWGLDSAKRNGHEILTRRVSMGNLAVSSVPNKDHKRSLVPRSSTEIRWTR